MLNISHYHVVDLNLSLDFNPLLMSMYATWLFSVKESIPITLRQYSASGALQKLLGAVYTRRVFKATKELNYILFHE